MTKIISALALLAVLAAATSSCSSNKEKVTVDTVSQIEDLAPIASDSMVDSIPADTSSISQWHYKQCLQSAKSFVEHPKAHYVSVAFYRHYAKRQTNSIPREQQISRSAREITYILWPTTWLCISLTMYSHFYSQLSRIVYSQISRT